MNIATVPQIIPVELATFTFAEDEPHAGEEGFVIGYVVRHTAGVLLMDTGFGFGNPEVDARYHPISRRVRDALAEVGVDLADIDAVVNCHLHIDHAGQNSLFAGIPIHVQSVEWHVAHTTEHTILDWIDFPDADYRQHDGDFKITPSLSVLATPGHTAGHQSVVLETADGRMVLAGQAVYSAGEWMGVPGSREGWSRAADRGAYAASINRLRALDPVRVYFAHDREVWTRQSAGQAGGYDFRAVLGGELAVPCTCNPLQQG